MPDRPRDAWLSLDEAAAHWGVARLRLREAIAAGVLRGQRDNSGFWRVWVEENRDLGRDLAAVRVAPDRLLDAMFDEIEELTHALSERNSEVERLGAVAARQQALLERALALAETAPSDEVGRLAALQERSQALVARSLASLEQREAALQHMTGLMGRSLDTVAGLDAEVERQRDTVRKQRVLLDRVFELARASLDRIGGGEPRGWFRRLRGRRSGARD